MDLSLLKTYALSFVGTKYHFGGDDPLSGFDCSGLVCELLRASGAVPYSYRDNAQGIFNRFEKNSAVNARGLGSLVFYGENLLKISHVGFCLDSYAMLEAGGGDATTQSEAVATQQNAFVRIRPIAYRKNLLIVLKPFYPGNI